MPDLYDLPRESLQLRKLGFGWRVTNFRFTLQRRFFSRCVVFKDNFGHFILVRRVVNAGSFFFFVLRPDSHYKPTIISGTSLLTTVAADATLANTVVKKTIKAGTDLRSGSIFCVVDMSFAGFASPGEKESVVSAK